jgi:outer membrane protein assembly factor BamB
VLVKQAAESSINFWEHEDVARVVTFGYTGNSQFTSIGHYVWLDDKTGKKKWTSARAPSFQGSSDKGFDYTKQYVVQDETNYTASQTYTNANKGETEWSINVRLSTGRYVEKWDVTDKGQTQSHPLEEILGRCSPAKTLVETK